MNTKDIHFFTDTNEFSNDAKNIFGKTQEEVWKNARSIIDNSNSLKEKLHIYQKYFVLKIIDDIKNRIANVWDDEVWLKTNMESDLNDFLEYKHLLNIQIRYSEFCDANINILEKEKAFFGTTEEWHKFYDSFEALEKKLAPIIKHYEDNKIVSVELPEGWEN